MMNYNVVGIKKINYTSRKTGQLVQGTELHCSFDDKNVLGAAVDKFYIPQRVDISHVQIGDVVNILFNRYGSVDFVQVL